MADYGMIGRGTSKGRVLGKLANYEKENSSVYIGVSIRKKVMDGKTVLSMSVDRTMPSDGKGKNPLPQEFTDREAFKCFIGDMVDSIEKQLS